MQNQILNQPVRKGLLLMAGPAVIGMLMTFLFQLVDTYFVGKLGTKELAAISFSYPVYILVVSLFMGFSAGVSSVVGRALGAQDQVKAKTASTMALVFMMLVTLGLGAIGASTIPQVFGFLGAGPEMLPLVDQYMTPLYWGMVALVGTLIANGSLMAKGLMVPATVVMGIGGMVNLVLDYLLIFGVGSIPPLGLLGASYATVFSWLVTLILMLVLLGRHELITLKIVARPKESWGPLQEVLKIGMPAVVAQILNPIAIAALTRVVSQYLVDQHFQSVKELFSPDTH